MKNKEIARRFRSLFAAKNQRKLSEILNVSPATISQWMKGTHPVPRARLMQAYKDNKNKGVTLDWILGTDLDCPAESDIPPPSFKTEAMGTVQDVISSTHDIIVRIREWWTSNRRQNPEWPDINVPSEADIDLERLGILPLESQLSYLEKAIEALNKMKASLPKSDFDTANFVTPHLVLESYADSLLRLRQMLMIGNLAKRVSRLESFVGTKSVEGKSDGNAPPAEANGAHVNSPPDQLSVDYAMGQMSLNRLHHAYLTGQLPKEEFRHIVAAIAKAATTVLRKFDERHGSDQGGIDQKPA